MDLLDFVIIGIDMKDVFAMEENAALLQPVLLSKTVIRQENYLR